MRFRQAPVDARARLMVRNEVRKRTRPVVTTAGEEEIDKKLYDIFPPAKRVRFANMQGKKVDSDKTKHNSNNNGDHQRLLQSHNVNNTDDTKNEKGDQVNRTANNSKRKRCYYSDLEKKRLWWSRQERTSMSEKARHMVKVFRKDHSDQVQHYLDVYDYCTQKPSQSSSDYLEQASIIIPTNVRGLEWGIVPTIKAHRRTHVQEILDIQEQIRGRLTAEMRYRVLSTRAMRSSRPSRVMARLMGEGDATSTTTISPAAGKTTNKRLPFSSSSAQVTTNLRTPTRQVKCQKTVKC